MSTTVEQLKTAMEEFLSEDAKFAARTVEDAGADAITVSAYHDTGNGKLHSESNIPHVENFNLPAAAEMKAETDKQASFLIADAKRQAEEMRGKAEAEAAAIYAAAHGKDPAFYRFLRELQSLRTVVDKNTTVVLDTSVAPFHWLKVKEGDGNPVKPVESAPTSPALIETDP